MAIPVMICSSLLVVGIFLSISSLPYSFAQNYFQPSPALLPAVQFDFSISANPSSLLLVAGQSVSSTINLELTNGSATNVQVSCSPNSASLSCQFTGGQTDSVTPTGSTVITIQAEKNTQPGPYTVVVSGTGGNEAHEITLEVTVSAAPEAPTPGTVGSDATQTGSYTATSGSTQCPPGYLYDPNVAKCVVAGGGQQVQGGGTMQCPPGYVYDHNIGQCVIQGGGHQVPSWIKNNAKWWSEGQISQDEFLKGIEYLVQSGIINPNVQPPGPSGKQEEFSTECYIKIDGIDGESNTTDLSGAIKVILFYWDLMQQGSGVHQQGNEIHLSHKIFFVHVIDKASPKIMLAVVNGQHFKSAQLECRKAGGGQQPYLTYTMSNVIISSVYQVHNGNSLPAERVGLDFESSQTGVDTYNMVTQNQLNSQAPISQGTVAKPTVPSWIKNNAKWWSEGQISQDEFLKGIEYLVQNNIISVNPHTDNTEHMSAPDCSLRGPGVNLQGCFLYQVNLENDDFTGANLNGATISSSNLRGIKLVNADLTGASIEGTDVSSSDMSNAKTYGLFLNNVDIRFANLHGDDLSKLYLSATYYFSFDDLSDTNLSKVYLQKFSFAFSNMERTNLSFADLSYSTLYSTDLTNAKLSCIKLSHADLRNSKLVSASFDDGNTHQRCVNLDQADLSGADLTNAYLSGADLPDANLNDAILTNADLSNTDLDGADLTGADLTGANLSHASLKGCIGYSGCH